MQIQDIYRALRNKWVIIDWIILTAALIALVLMLSYLIQYRSRRVVIAQLRNDIRLLEAMRERSRNEIEKYGFEKKEFAAILVDILTAARKSHVRLDDTTISDAILFGDYRVIPLSIKLHGTYNQIGLFINLVEKNALIKMCELNLTKDNQEPCISASVKIELAEL